MQKNIVFRNRLSHSLPHDGVVGGLVLGLALHADELHARGVQRRRDLHLNLLRQEGVLELRTPKRNAVRVEREIILVGCRFTNGGEPLPGVYGDSRVRGLPETKYRAEEEQAL